MKKWFPGVLKLKEGNNPSRLHSIWLGIVVPMIELPMIVWRNVVSPLIGGITVSLIGVLVSAGAISVLVFAGLAGRLVTAEQTNDAP